MDRKQKIAEKIKTMRMSRGMSQTDLAIALHCGQSTIAMYESAKRLPDYDIIDALADVFNVPRWSILYDENEMIPKEDAEDMIWKKREELRRDPKRKMLLDLAENGTAKDVDAVASLIDALKATNSDFYEGDDPA